MNLTKQLTPEDIFYFSKLSQLGIEEWIDIPGYEGLYEISNLGQVRSLDVLVESKGGSQKLRKGRTLKLSPTNNGYMKFTICKKGSKAVGYIHNLVATSFLGLKPESLFVCHNNGVRSDNRLFNLRFDTPKSNQEDREKHGTTYRGSQLWSSKLIEKDIPQIRELLNRGTSHRKIAKKFGVTKTTIGYISRGKTWKHI